MAERAKPKANDPILGLPGEIKPLRVLLFILTALSAVAALFLEPALAGAVKRGALSAPWLFIPIAMYGVFVLAYAGDRMLLVKRRNYPAGRAFFQVAFAMVFGLLLLPETYRDWNERRRPAGIDRLLVHRDPQVRQVAVEAIGYRGVSVPRARALMRKLDDKSSDVRRTAATVLAGWAKKDPADLPGLKTWVGKLSQTSTTGGVR